MGVSLFVKIAGENSLLKKGCLTIENFMIDGKEKVQFIIMSLIETGLILKKQYWQINDK